MTATGNPAAALAACINAMTPPRGAEERAAVVLAQEAVRGHPVPSASLETAACAWEAVLDMESFTAPAGREDEYKRQTARAAAIAAARELFGSSHLRLTVLGWVPLIDAAWKDADTDGGKVPGGGEYSEAFDWEFVPDWIVANVYWTVDGAPIVDPAAALAQGNFWGGVEADNDDPPAALIIDALDLLDRVDNTMQDGDTEGYFMFHPNDGGEPRSYRFTVSQVSK